MLVSGSVLVDTSPCNVPLFGCWQSDILMSQSYICLVWVIVYSVGNLIRKMLSRDSEGPGGGYSHIVWVGMCRWVRESPTLY